MPDIYPDFPDLPREWLVPPEDQPTYLDVPGVQLDELQNLGYSLSNAQVARGLGDHTALINHEEQSRLTFRDLADQSDTLAAFLSEQGVRPGQRIGVRTPNRPEGIIAMIAIWKVGGVVVPIPHRCREKEFRFFLSDTTPDYLITYCDEDIEMVLGVAQESDIKQAIVYGGTQDTSEPWVTQWDDIFQKRKTAPEVQIPLDAVAIIWHTGGTTGVPKGCYHTQRRMLLSGYSYGMATGASNGQIWLSAAPIGHALGLIAHTIFTLLNGATVVMVEKYTNPLELLRAIQASSVQTFVAITATWSKLLEVLAEHPELEPSTLTTGYGMWQSSSSHEVIDGWKQRGITLLNNFGSTAFGNWVIIPQNGHPQVQGSLGKPTPGYEIRAIDPESSEDVEPGVPGRLLVRGASGLTYWKLPEKQKIDVRDGWMYIDDLVVEEPDGNYGYMGRTDFLISSAGNKIAPSEVEAVLGSHHAVREVSVVGVPDPIRHQVVAAAVVTGARSDDEALRRELQEYVRRELSPYKSPRILIFLDKLPRDHVGKVQTSQVKAEIMEQAGISQ